jgi:hypothetical protein
VIAYFKDENSKWSFVPEEYYYQRKGTGEGPDVSQLDMKPSPYR